MVNLDICIGSACYVKGSNQIVNIVNDLLKSEGWEDKVNIKGSFCMKSCQNKYGIGIKINGEAIKGITLSNAKEIIKQEIIKNL